jgi:hypothetical protein
MYPVRLPQLPDLIKGVSQAGCQAASLKIARVGGEFLTEAVFQVVDGLPQTFELKLPM